MADCKQNDSFSIISNQDLPFQLGFDQSMFKFTHWGTMPHHTISYDVDDHGNGHTKKVIQDRARIELRSEDIMALPAVLFGRSLSNIFLAKALQEMWLTTQMLLSRLICQGQGYIPVNV